MRVVEWVGKGPSGRASVGVGARVRDISWKRRPERGWRNHGSVWKRVGMKEVCSRGRVPR
jgi:hypothetical protein